MGFPAAVMKDGKFALFMEQTKLPHHETSLQQELINASVKQQDLKQNFGFRVPDRIGKDLVHKPYHVRSTAAWATFYKAEINKYNAPNLSLEKRLDMLYKDPIGAALVMGKTKEGKRFLTFVNLPMVTEPDMEDNATLGAGDLAEIYDEDALRKWNLPLVGQKHWVLGSAGWKTRTTVGDDMSSFITAGKPVLFPDASEFCGVTATSKEYRVLLLPELCTAPVGLYWPVDAKLEGINEALDGIQAYNPFKLMLQQNEATFAKWLTAAADNPDEFAVTMRDSAPLLTNLITLEDVVDKDNLDIMKEMPARWTFALANDAYMADATAEGQIFAQHWENLVANAIHRYPAGPYEAIHSHRRPFVTHLFHSPYWPEKKPASVLLDNTLRTLWVKKWDTEEVSIIVQDTSRSPLKSKHQKSAQKLQRNLAQQPEQEPAAKQTTASTQEPTNGAVDLTEPATEALQKSPARSSFNPHQKYQAGDSFSLRRPQQTSHIGYTTPMKSTPYAQAQEQMSAPFTPEREMYQQKTRGWQDRHQQQYQTMATRNTTSASGMFSSAQMGAGKDSVSLLTSFKHSFNSPEEIKQASDEFLAFSKLLEIDNNFFASG